MEFLFLLNNALELITVQSRDYSICRLWIIFYPADDSALMLCHLLATVDRYLSIARYEWYKANVTNRAVVLLITLALALSFFVITSPFWTGYKSIYTCTVNLTHVLSVNVWNLLLGIVCLLLQFKIFGKTKTFVRNYVPKYCRSLSASVKFVQSIPPVESGNSGKSGIDSVLPFVLTFRLNEQFLGERTESRVSISFHEPTDPDATENGRGDRMNELPSVTDPEDAGCFSRKPKGSRIGRMKIQAAHSLFINIVTFWLCTLPISCSVLVTYWCVWAKGDCDVIFQTWTYVWNAYILHSIYNPVMHMITCSEFHQALFEMKEIFISKCFFLFITK
jgi:hypothetical protein